MTSCSLTVSEYLGESTRVVVRVMVKGAPLNVVWMVSVPSTTPHATCWQPLLVLSVPLMR